MCIVKCLLLGIVLIIILHMRIFLYVFVRLLSSIFLFIKSFPLKTSRFDLNDYLIVLILLYMKEVEMNNLLNCFPKMQNLVGTCGMTYFPIM